MLEISVKEVVARLTSDNPWWEEQASIDSHYLGLPFRSYFPSFFALITETKVSRAVILMGPRRVGKTVMVQQAVQKLLGNGIKPKQILYVSVDTPTYAGLSLEKLLSVFMDRNGLKQTDEMFVFFDEIQYLKDWEVHLKSLVDTYRSVRFVASGSSAAALRLKSRESGAGRFTDFMLPPLTFSEYIHFVEREDELIEEYKGKHYPTMVEYNAKDIDELNSEFIKYLNFGGYPEAVMSKIIQQNPSRYIRSDIIDKVLLRDLPSLYGIHDIQELNNLFTTIAYNTSEQVSLSALAQSSGVAKNTIKRYLEYLEAAFLIVRVRRLDDKGKDFARERGFKVYLTNPSLWAALFHPVTQDDDAMGRLAETAVFSQLLHLGHMDRTRYARWKQGEVDIVFLRRETLKPAFACEIKWSDRYFNRPGELKSLLEFARKNNLNYLSATTKTKEGSTEIDGTMIDNIPCSLYCYRLGRRSMWY